MSTETSFAGVELRAFGFQIGDQVCCRMPVSAFGTWQGFYVNLEGRLYHVIITSGGTLLLVPESDLQHAKSVPPSPYKSV